MQRVLAGVLLVSTAACGLTMTRGPDPQRPPAQRPVCTESMQAPKRDAFGALAGFGLLFVGALFATTGDNETVGVPLLVAGGVLMAGSYASGGIGYYRVKRCRKAITAWEQQPPPGGAPPL